MGKMRRLCHTAPPFLPDCRSGCVRGSHDLSFISATCQDKPTALLWRVSSPGHLFPFNWAVQFPWAAYLVVTSPRTHDPHLTAVCSHTVGSLTLHIPGHHPAVFTPNTTNLRSRFCDYLPCISIACSGTESLNCRTLNTMICDGPKRR